MKYRLPLRNRLLLIIISTVAVIYSLGIGYISIRYKEKAKQDAVKLIQAVASEKAALIKARMDHDFAISRSMAQSLLACERSTAKEKEQLQFTILTNILKSNPNYIASFLQWELSDVEANYTKPHGRRRFLSYRQYPVIQNQSLPGLFAESPIDTIKGRVDIDSYDPSNPYYIVRESHQEFIINPYFYSYDNVKEMPADYPTQPDAILETTIIIPIIENNEFKALTGVDIPLNHFMDLVKEISPFKNSFAFVVANNGNFVAHPNVEFLAKPLTDCQLLGDMQHEHFADIKNGRSFSYTTNTDDKGKMLFVMAPIPMGNTNQPWALGIGIPEKVILAEAEKDFYISIAAGIMGLLVLTILIAWFSRSVTRPIESTTQLLNSLAKGEISKSPLIKVNTKDELEHMAKSANILQDGLIRTTRFAHEIGEGELNTSYQLLSEEDVLGRSLIEMRDKLKASKLEIEQQNQELEKLSMVAQKTDNAVIIMDGSGKLEWVNTAFERMYGYTLEEIKANFGYNLTDLSTFADIRIVIDKCCSHRETVAYNSILKSKEGEAKYAQTTLTPVLDNTGYVVKMIAIDSDITSLKKANIEIEKQKNELEKLNATKDKFFSIMAHDLKNPFTTVHSLSAIIHNDYKTLDEEDKQDIVTRIHDSSQHIYSLLDNLLTWSRSQRGMIECNPIDFSLYELVNTIFNLNSNDARHKNIKLEHNAEEDIRINADREMIATVLRNLINNAIKFTPNDGAISLEVNSGTEAISICVKDSGIGISATDINKLFRIDINTRAIGPAKDKGTGLGLVLCKEFIERNGGSIKVESEINVGSLFTITIPQKN
ncbi:ATP-binding protein [Carboxylicivirga sp. N1Y90]|uniref:ATP-binding protein n=1 Tax=Carboxylicivirga fragile TaxID=3417571 RepID=UPI003D34C84C|nr:PAS domain S-box protein [Marinilabiliaceae bacterium N1Y90]